METQLYTVPGYVTGKHRPEINAIIDTWESLMISQEQFVASVHDIGIKFAEKNNVSVWIVDTSNAQGVYKKEVQTFIDAVLAPTCARIGIKYFFVVLPNSAISKLSARNVAKINGKQDEMQTIPVASVHEALHMLKEVSV